MSFVTMRIFASPALDELCYNENFRMVLASSFDENGLRSIASSTVFRHLAGETGIRD